MYLRKSINKKKYFRNQFNSNNLYIIVIRMIIGVLTTLIRNHMLKVNKIIQITINNSNIQDNITKIDIRNNRIQDQNNIIQDISNNKKKK
jgi:hypothetical protein